LSTHAARTSPDADPPAASNLPTEAGASTEADLPGTTLQLKDALGRFFALVEPTRVELWNERGLTLGQLRLLFAVRDAAGASTGEVGQAIGLTGSSLTGLVDRVAALGFVRREPDQQDRRVTRLWLTDAGATLVAEFESAREADFSAVLAQLPPAHRRDLARLFTEFVDAAQHLIEAQRLGEDGRLGEGGRGGASTSDERASGPVEHGGAATSAPA